MKKGSNLGNQLPKSRITYKLNPEGNSEFVKLTQSFLKKAAFIHE